MQDFKLKGKLVNAQELLKTIWSDECRPSLRWLRQQTKAKAIPYVRLGHLVFFDVEMVRAYLAEKHLLHGRPGPARGKWGAVPVRKHSAE